MQWNGKKVATVFANRMLIFKKSINQIPVGALTHLMFSFAYISPGDFNIVPMDDLPEKLFRDFAALKKKNSALKIMVALGGWTFNDPGPTQTVFHDVCASSASRAKFIANLLSFFRQFGFDGVDFDWVSCVCWQWMS